MAFSLYGSPRIDPEGDGEFIVHAPYAEILVDDTHGSSRGVEDTVQFQGVLHNLFFVVSSFADIKSDAPQPYRQFVFIEDGGGEYFDGNALTLLRNQGVFRSSRLNSHDLLKNIIAQLVHVPLVYHLLRIYPAFKILRAETGNIHEHGVGEYQIARVVQLKREIRQ